MSEMSIPWAVQELTKGQPFAFVAMAYPRAEHAQTFQHVYSVIHEVVTERFGMACVRADAVPGSGHDLLAKLHYLMEQADLVIADISEDRPNVFYEIGYAVGRGKPPLLVCRRGRDVPTDLRGLEVIEYGEGWDGPAEFRRQLESHLKVLVGAELPILSDMLLAPNPRPAYIVAGSRYATQQAQSVGQSYHHRTFGDRLGILGLVSTFGALMGGAGAIELISAKYSPPDLLG
ncbi:MAG: hypothetical protein QM473_14805, partial [Acidobacteriota bacterium]|nr:hypothetical protein [Acidobacteriota bacterium]